MGETSSAERDATVVEITETVMRVSCAFDRVVD